MCKNSHGPADSGCPVQQYWCQNSIQLNFFTHIQIFTLVGLLEKNNINDPARKEDRAYLNPRHIITWVNLMPAIFSNVC